MIDHMAPLRNFHTPFIDMSPGMIGLADCDSPFPYLRDERGVAENYIARHFSGAQQALGTDELDNVYWPPGMENPAGGLAGAKSDHSVRGRVARFEECHMVGFASG